jgi:hypothetical protein
MFSWPKYPLWRLTISSRLVRAWSNSLVVKMSRAVRTILGLGPASSALTRCQVMYFGADMLKITTKALSATAPTLARPQAHRVIRRARWRGRTLYASNELARVEPIS